MTHHYHVFLVQPDATWQTKFAHEKQRLLRRLGDVAIEHIGSTSISGLIAKPIIDIIIGVASMRKLKPAQKVICELGYVLEGSREGHYWLSSPSPDNRHYIIHLVVKNGQEWKKRISFRDYLRLNPSSAREYQDLKQELAIKYAHDLDAYTFGKAFFVATIISLAKKITA